MADHSVLLDIVACPRCDKAPLDVADKGMRCTACKSEFPAIGDVPWLFAEPAASLGEWRNRLHFALQSFSAEVQRIGIEMQDESLSPLTRKRLEHQSAAIEQHRNDLRELLAPLDIHGHTGNYESYLAMRTRLPTDQGIATYYANVHRDWSWGDDENRESLATVREVAGDHDFGKTLVIGAGAGRLAYDLHQSTDATLTVSMDFNPLLILVGERVCRGDELTLFEFPIAPRSIDDFAVQRTLAAPEPVRDGFVSVLADALRPPFQPAAFDTIVTPWLVDVLGDDLHQQAARINAMLRPGGRWLNFGSLSFSHPLHSRCYSTEETLELVAGRGFEVEKSVDKVIPYMCSPASRHGRREMVLAFSAQKSAGTAAAERHRALPDWIVTGREAVPALPAFTSQAMSTRIHAYIMSMIDGKRTLEEMATILEQQQLMTRDEALPALRNFLARMYEDTERVGRF